MDMFWQVFFILISFGAAYITSSYFWGFFFKKASAALKYFPLMNFLIIYAVPWMLCGPIFTIYNSDYICKHIMSLLSLITLFYIYLASDLYDILNGIA